MEVQVWALLLGEQISVNSVRSLRADHARSIAMSMTKIFGDSTHNLYR